MIDFYRNIITDIISNNTCMEYDEIIQMESKNKIELDKRDYIEIILRIEAVFDCTLDMLNVNVYEFAIDDIVQKLYDILN